MDLSERFELGKKVLMSERFLLPHSIDQETVMGLTSIRYNKNDQEIIQDIHTSLEIAFKFVEDWFCLKINFPIQLWLASNIDELQCIVAMKCSDDYFFAPGKV